MPNFSSRSRSGFTLVELMVAMAVATIVFVAAFEFLAMSTRMGARNLSSNLGHQTLLLSTQRLTHDLEGAVTGYGLVNWSGDALSELTEANGLLNTGTRDAASNLYLSTAANGVKFRRMLGPGTLLESIATGGTSVLISMPAPAKYDVPNKSDLLYIPLLTCGYRISGVSGGNPVSATDPTVTYTLTLGDMVQTPVNVVSGSSSAVSVYILKRSAYAVVEKALYYFPTVPNAASLPLTGPNTIYVRGNVMTPTPFTISYGATLGQKPNNEVLRTLLQSYDSSLERKESTDQRSTVVTLTMPRLTLKNAPN